VLCGPLVPYSDEHRRTLAHALAELALQNGKLMLEKQDLRNTPGDIPVR
jgi:hypothetical protein